MGFHIILPGTASKNGRVTPQARKWRIFWSYLPDWILTIFLWGVFYLLDKIDGYRRVFSVTDPSLAHPMANPERVKVWHLAIYAGIIPAVIIVLTGAFVRRSPWDIHSGVLGFLLCLGLSTTFTDILKITAGKPRPDLYDRCQLPTELTANPVHGLVSWTMCTRTDLLQDGFRSFPSGHSSFAWAGMWYLILYSSAKLGISNRRGYTWKSWLLLAPLSAAALISITRTMDYRHHSTDVIAGAIIGVLAAWFAYRQFYPRLSHPQAYKPYSPRVPKDDEIPLHELRSPQSQSNSQTVRPSMYEPHSTLIPAQPRASVPPNSHNGTYVYGAPSGTFDGSAAYPAHKHSDVAVQGQNGGYGGSTGEQIGRRLVGATSHDSTFGGVSLSGYGKNGGASNRVSVEDVGEAEETVGRGA